MEISANKYYFTDLLEPYLANELKVDAGDNVSLEDLIETARQKSIDIHFLKRLENPRIKHCLGIARNLMPSTLLDIGSGKGFFLWGMLEVNPVIRITAVDMNNKLLERIAKVAKYSGASIETTDCNAEGMSFDDNMFEMVSMLEVMEHTKNGD